MQRSQNKGDRSSSWLPHTNQAPVFHDNDNSKQCHDREIVRIILIKVAEEIFSTDTRVPIVSFNMFVTILKCVTLGMILEAH